MLIKLLLIQWIIVFIIDISGVIDSLKSFIAKILSNGRIKSTDFRIKPLDCSLCSTFWVSVIFLLVTHCFTLPYIAFVCLMSATTSLTKDLFYTLNDLIVKMLQKIDSIK